MLVAVKRISAGSANLVSCSFFLFLLFCFYCVAGILFVGAACTLPFKRISTNRCTG